MSELIACPSCQRQLQVPENFLGQLVQCPDCQHQFTAEPPVSAVQTAAPVTVPVKVSPSAPEKPAPKYDEDDQRGRRDADNDFGDLRSPRRSEYVEPHRATLVLIMGLLSICCVASLITGLIAWIMGSADLKEMDAGRMDSSGRTQTQTGRILGMIGFAINVLIIVGYCGVMIVALGTGMIGGRRRF